MKNKYYMGKQTVSVHGMRPTADGKGRISVKLADRTAEVTMEIDFDDLAYYARRAVSSKLGKSKALGGAIVFKVVAGTVAEIAIPEPD